jgi:exo-1,4-beta-D-glucosaminidase
MFGWMCCNQWEKWDQWDAADRRIAEQSLQSQISMLRSHAAVFLWANGSDGRAPDAVRATYHHVLQDLHWQNATVDTVSSYNKGPDGDPIWDGIHMEGPYS